MIVRCAKCGSKNVIVNEKNDGYDLKKGVIGVALLGTGGAVMGVNGKKTNVLPLPRMWNDFTLSNVRIYCKKN